MDILIIDSWLREYLKTDATPKEIKEYLLNDLELTDELYKRALKTNIIKIAKW